MTLARCQGLMSHKHHLTHTIRGESKILHMSQAAAFAGVVHIFSERVCLIYISLKNLCAVDFYWFRTIQYVHFSCSNMYDHTDVSVATSVIKSFTIK